MAYKKNEQKLKLALKKVKKDETKQDENYQRSIDKPGDKR